MLTAVLVIVALAWLATIAVVVGMCMSAARGDAALRRAPKGARGRVAAEPRLRLIA